MNTSLRSIAVAFFFLSCLFSSVAKAADTAVSIGWHNPVTSSFGVNAGFFWTNVVFEVGIGNLDVAAGDHGSGLVLGGDIDLKYRFGTNPWRPYVEAGLGYGFAAGSKPGLSFGADGPFVGGGVMYIGSKVLVYGGVDVNAGNHVQPFFGIGMKI